VLSHADASLARRDGAIAGLALLLNPEAFVAELVPVWGRGGVDSAELSYVRYKPGTNCVAGYRIRTGGRTLQIYAKAHASDAGVKLDKARVRDGVAGEAGPGRVVLEGRGVVVSVFPDDAKVRVLARLEDPEGRRRLLARVLRELPDLADGSIQTLAYKPERRYVGRFAPAGGGDVVLKFYADSGFPAALRNASALESRGALRLATRVGRSKRYCVLALEWLPGRTLREELASPGMELGRVARVGEAVAELHAQESRKLSAPPAGAERARLRSIAETLGFLCPPLAGRAEALVGQVAARLNGSAAGRRPIHGDLYDKQVLVDGDAVAIVDLDQAALGDPRADLGLFIAHLERHAIVGSLDPERVCQVVEALLEGYQRASGSSVRGLGTHVAHGLVSLAHHPFRTRQPDWPAGTERILDRAEEILGTSE
jgi:aminoglycoside phosphotransferase (APT) family kinase protein